MQNKENVTIDKIIDKVYDWYEEYEPEQNDIFEWDN